MDATTEPTFTLRASHAGTADCLNQHASTAKDLGAPAEYVESVQKAVEDFRAWPVSVAPGTEASAELKAPKKDEPEHTEEEK